MRLTLKPNVSLSAFLSCSYASLRNPLYTFFRPHLAVRLLIGPLEHADPYRCPHINTLLRLSLEWYTACRCHLKPARYLKLFRLSQLQNSILLLSIVKCVPFHSHSWTMNRLWLRISACLRSGIAMALSIFTRRRTSSLPVPPARPSKRRQTDPQPYPHYSQLPPSNYRHPEETQRPQSRERPLPVNDPYTSYQTQRPRSGGAQNPYVSHRPAVDYSQQAGQSRGQYGVDPLNSRRPSIPNYAQPVRPQEQPLMDPRNQPRRYSSMNQRSPTQEIRIHPLIKYTPHVATGHPSCSLVWDLRQSPRTIHSISSAALSSLELSQHATSVPVPTITIKCGLFPHPFPARSSQGVSIFDIIEAIYRAGRQGISSAEWEPLSERQQGRIARVFHERCRSSPDPNAEKSRGVRRTDCLGGYTRFAGLEIVPSTNAEGVCCVLTLDRVRGEARIATDSA
jgi:hypothetical protein